MARIIRRHWLIVAVYLTVIAVGVIWLTTLHMRSSIAQTVDQTPAASKLDPMLYGTVQQLREQLCLTNRDLAAAGCNQTQAEMVLTNLLTWCQANQVQFHALEQQQVQARRQVGDAMRKINVGPRDPVVINRLPQLQRQWSSAQDSLATFRGTALDATESQLASDQRMMLHAARQNHARNLPDQWRYVPQVTDEQVKTLAKAQRRLAQQETGHLATFSAVRMLNGTQQQVVDQARQNQQQNMAAVLAAEEAVLPIPEQLKRQLLMPPMPEGLQQPTEQK